MGNPAARSARAKWVMLCVSLGSSGNSSGAYSVMAPRGGGAPTSPEYSDQEEPSGRRQRAAHLVEDTLGLGALHPGDIVLIFQDRTKRVGDHLGAEADHVERQHALGPVDGLCYARFLEQIFSAQRLDESHNLAAQLLRRLRRTRLQYLDFALEGRVIHPVIETPTLQCVMHLARAVRGQD